MICAVIPQPEEIALDATEDEQACPMEKIRNASVCDTVKFNGAPVSFGKCTSII